MAEVILRMLRTLVMRLRRSLRLGISGYDRPASGEDFDEVLEDLGQLCLGLLLELLVGSDRLQDVGMLGANQREKLALEPDHIADGDIVQIAASPREDRD